MTSRTLVSVLMWLLLNVSARATAPAVYSPAPAFKLQDQHGTFHTLSEYRGKWVVLYFYPKDGTPGCTTEACEFRDNVFAFREVNAVIVGISVDDNSAHQQFAQKHGLPFTLLADPTKTTARAYGVMHGLSGLIGLAQRNTFLINPDGQIAKHYTQVEPKTHSRQVLADLKTLQKTQGRIAAP